MYAKQIFVDVPAVDYSDLLERSVSLNFTVMDDYIVSIWKIDDNYVEHVHADVDRYYCSPLAQYVWDTYHQNINCTVFAIRIINTLTELRASWTGEVGMRYEQSVELALTSLKKFSTFKSHEAYTSIVEVLSSSYGYIYFDFLMLNSVYLRSWEGTGIVDSLLLLNLLRQNDRIGSPPSMCDIPLPGGVQTSLSALTLRYLKVAFDLDMMFNLFGHYRKETIFSGSSEVPALRIAEIGCGYGGQSQTLYAVNEATFARETATPHISYHYFDLVPVVSLISKYMAYFPWIDPGSLHFHHGGVNPVTATGTGAGTDAAVAEMGTEEQWKYDLCISNYAISELPLEVQFAYVDAELGRCKAGYITYNHVSDARPLEAFRTRLKQALGVGGNEVHIYEVREVPLTDELNRILMWGNTTGVVFL